MKVGSWGDIIKFSVSEDKILTFSGMKHSTPVQVQTHTRVNGKPKLQFVAPGLDTVSFTMELHGMYCRKPKKTEDLLRNAAQSGTYAPLVVGNRTILRQAIITSLSSSYDEVIMDGRVLSMKIDVTLTEYV